MPNKEKKRHTQPWAKVEDLKFQKIFRLRNDRCCVDPKYV